jgi:hypothetical protein
MALSLETGTTRVVWSIVRGMMGGVCLMGGCCELGVSFFFFPFCGWIMEWAGYRCRQWSAFTYVPIRTFVPLLYEGLQVEVAHASVTNGLGQHWCLE